MFKFGLHNILGEPLSPMSDARDKGLHYTVKEKRYGYECLICGLLGDIRWIRASPCKPKETPSESEPLSDATLKLQQEAQDEQMARELHELQVQEQELQQMLVLQQLENEELLLQGLLNEQRTLDLAEKTAAAALAAQARLKEAQAIPTHDAPATGSGALQAPGC